MAISVDLELVFIRSWSNTQTLDRFLNRNQLNRWPCRPRAGLLGRSGEGASFSLFRCFFVCFSLICQRPAECRVHANEFEPGTSDWAPGPVYLSFINQGERGGEHERKRQRGDSWTNAADILFHLESVGGLFSVYTPAGCFSRQYHLWFKVNTSIYSMETQRTIESLRLYHDKFFPGTVKYYIHGSWTAILGYDLSCRPK